MSNKKEPSIEMEILSQLDRMMGMANVILAGEQYSQQNKDTVKQIINDSLDMVNEELNPIKINQLVNQEIAKNYKAKLLKEME